MTPYQRGFFNIITAAFDTKEVVLPTDFPWEDALRDMGRQRAEVLFYYGLKNVTSPIPQNIQEESKRQAYLFFAHGTRQEDALCHLYEFLEENNIFYLPLKGSVVRALYPQPEFRYMGDADILIKPEQRDFLCEKLTAAGYTFIVEGAKESVWQCGALRVEFHKRLTPPRDTDYHAYWNDPWGRAFSVGGTKYDWRKEDHYLYQVMHAATHFRDHGIGIKILTDTYLLEQQPLDWAYIADELPKMGLERFCEHLRHAARVCFENAPETETDQIIYNRIFDSGAYGTEQTGNLSEGLRAREQAGGSSARFLRYWNRLFPSYAEMALRYAPLRRHKWMLLWYWLYRLVYGVLFRRESIASQSRQAFALDKQSINEWSQTLERIGLSMPKKQK